MFLISKILSR